MLGEELRSRLLYSFCWRWQEKRHDKEVTGWQGMRHDKERMKGESERQTALQQHLLCSTETKQQKGERKEQNTGLNSKGIQREGDPSSSRQEGDHHHQHDHLLLLLLHDVSLHREITWKEIKWRGWSHFTICYDSSLFSFVSRLLLILDLLIAAKSQRVIKSVINFLWNCNEFNESKLMRIFLLLFLLDWNRKWGLWQGHEFNK